jgi:hypothetical protein
MHSQSKQPIEFVEQLTAVVEGQRKRSVTANQHPDNSRRATSGHIYAGVLSHGNFGNSSASVGSRGKIVPINTPSQQAEKVIPFGNEQCEDF